jgi:hypothetical protein
MEIISFNFINRILFLCDNIYKARVNIRSPGEAKGQSYLYYDGSCKGHAVPHGLAGAAHVQATVNSSCGDITIINITQPTVNTSTF